MRDRAYLGIERWLLPLPGALWRRQIAAAAAGIASTNRRLMSEEHRRVHYAAVRELARTSAPLSHEEIAGAAAVPVARVTPILEELERRLTFLVRNQRGEVTWAFPVTVDVTPHHVTFKSGERLDAA